MDTPNRLPEPRGQIDVIQMLRGIAAILVVMFHCTAYETPSQSNDLVKWLTDSGASGVDLFFCISGFIMMYTTRQASPKHALDFAIKRFCRVVPTYVIATLAFAAVMGEVFNVLGYDDPLYHLRTRDIIKSLLFIPLQPSDPGRMPLWGIPTLHVGWSLNYEMYFYAVFAVSLLFRRLRWVVFFGWMLLTLCALPLIFRGTVAVDAYHFYDWKTLPYLNLVTSGLVWEFVVGVIIGHLYLRRWAFPNVETAWLATVASVVFVLWMMFNQVSPGFGPTRWGSSYIVLLAVLLLADNTVGFRVPRFLVWLGNISYSLYLVHPFVVEGIGIPLLHVNAMRPYLVGPPYVLLLTILSICLAYPVHVWIERRLSDTIRRKLQLWAGLRVRRVSEPDRKGIQATSQATPVSAPPGQRVPG